MNNKLKETRLRMEMGQIEFSRLIGIHQGNLSLIESGKKGMLTKKWVDTCRTLGVSLDYMLYNEAELTDTEKLNLINRYSREILSSKGLK